MTLLPFVALAALVASPSFGARPSSDETPPAFALDAAVVEGLRFQRPDFLARVETYSAQHLGIPYKNGPLGEGCAGEGCYDSDPLISFESVDCVTLVEQTLAMACADDRQSMQEHLNRLRYKGNAISYATRNHFPEADWLPNNIAAGYLEDITRDVAGDDAKTATKTIKKRDWYAAKSTSNLEGAHVSGLDDAEKQALVGSWQALGLAMPDESAALPYLPMDKLPKHLDKIPSGTVVSIVREDDPKMPVLISHLGFLIRKDGQVFFRHASFNDKVVDAPFVDYFYKYYNARWRVAGLNLARPSRPR